MKFYTLSFDDELKIMDAKEILQVLTNDPLPDITETDNGFELRFMNTVISETTLENLCFKVEQFLVQKGILTRFFFTPDYEHMKDSLFEMVETANKEEKHKYATLLADFFVKFQED